MVKKYVRFNYFSINLVPETMPAGMANRNIGSAWDMTDLLDYLSIKRNQMNGVIDVGEYKAEFERETLLFDSKAKVYSFQLSKLRTVNIPAVKKFGLPKEDLKLKDDEYIGEFVTIVFDPTFCTAAVQSNKYSLNLKQIEKYLTELRKMYNNSQNNTDRTPLRIELQPILDIKRANTIKNAAIFRKITVKGTDAMADALAQQGIITEISEVIGRAQGINFEVTISLGHAPKSESLDHETVQEIINGFHKMDEKSRPKVEITAREDEEAALELVNLAAPTLSNTISLDVEERKGIGHEYIHQAFMEKYTVPRGRIAAINRPLD